MAHIYSHMVMLTISINVVFVRLLVKTRCFIHNIYKNIEELRNK